jgi:hypothetical protein
VQPVPKTFFTTVQPVREVQPVPPVPETSSVQPIPENPVAPAPPRKQCTSVAHNAINKLVNVVKKEGKQKTLYVCTPEQIQLYSERDTKTIKTTARGDDNSRILKDASVNDDTETYFDKLDKEFRHTRNQHAEKKLKEAAIEWYIIFLWICSKFIHEKVTGRPKIKVPVRVSPK